VILGHEFAQQMQAMFADDLAASQPIDLARWENRPLHFRVKEWLATLWARLL
jgi:cardiolipin synthase